MYTSMMTALLFAFVGENIPEKHAWHTDYAQAVKLVKEERKPLAVFVGSGSTGYDKISDKGKLAEETKAYLLANYVCLYLDLKTSEGKRLAGAFEIASGQGIVISSRDGDSQAFRHDGDLADKELSRYLKRYADPDFVVNATETKREEHRANYYAPPPVQTQSC